MDTGNPYQSPSGSPDVVANRYRVCGVSMVVVLLNVVVNAYNVVRNWPELTIFHYAVGTVLWLVLPLLAVFLIWRNRPIGRWLLIVLFGLRVVVGLLQLATDTVKGNGTAHPLQPASTGRWLKDGLWPERGVSFRPHHCPVRS